MKQDIENIKNSILYYFRLICEKHEEVSKAFESDKDLWYKVDFSDKLLVSKNSIKLFNGDTEIHIMLDDEEDTVLIETRNSLYTAQELLSNTEHAMARLLAMGKVEK